MEVEMAKQDVTQEEIIIRTIAVEYVAGRAPDGVDEVCERKFGKREWRAAKKWARHAPIEVFDSPTGKVLAIDVTAAG
jgi:hypothetical protein